MRLHGVDTERHGSNASQWKPFLTVLVFEQCFLIPILKCKFGKTQDVVRHEKKGQARKRGAKEMVRWKFGKK